MSSLQTTATSTSSSTKQIGIADLRIADVIFSTRDTVVSRAIRTVTGSQFSHSLLSVGDGMIVEATEHGGVLNRSATAALCGTSLAVVMRHNGLTEGQRDAIRDHALQWVGKAYDTMGMYGAGTRSSMPVTAGVCLLMPSACFLFEANKAEKTRDEKFFCAELVCRAFELSGVPLCDRSPSYVNPQEVYRSTRLSYVGHLRT